MPSVADEPAHGGAWANACRGVSVPCRKRRWDDSRGSSSSSDVGSHGTDAVVSILLPDDGLGRKLAAAASSSSSSTSTSFLRNPASPSQRKILLPGSKRLRFSSDSSNNNNNAADESRRLASSASTTPAMQSCHVCQRKPRRKTDLDSQADCDGCGQRTCFVCLRECPGWSTAALRDACAEAGQTTPTTDDEEFSTTSEHGGMCLGVGSKKRASPRPWSATSRGHRRIVCSRCCVERGQDGDVVCLGCMTS